MRIRTRQGPVCPSLLLSEHRWFTNWSSPRLSDTLSTFNPGGTLHTFPSSKRQWEESCIDDVGVDGRFRDCSHTFRSNEFFNQRNRHLFPGSGDSNVPVGFFGSASYAALDSFAAAPDVDMSAMADEACAYMLPQINEGTSLVNFVLELKDLKSWMKAGTAVARIKGKHLNKMGRYTKKRSEINLNELPYNDLVYSLPGGKQKMFKDILRRLTGAHLEASFGIVPLVGDLAGIFHDLNNIENKLMLLKRFANRRQVRHYSRVLPASSGVPATREWRYLSPVLLDTWGNTPYNSDGAGGSGNRTAWGPIRTTLSSRWIQRPVYHATMRYSYSLPSMGPIEEGIKARMDALGLRLDPSIIWNAIPYTFLVDWVVDIGSFLRTFARDNYPIETKLTDFCHSVAYHSERRVEMSYSCCNVSPFFPTPFWWFDTHGWNTTVDMGTIYRGSLKSYNRVRHIPDIHTIKTKIPKLKQLALAGSLILNKSLGGHGRKRG